MKNELEVVTNVEFNKQDIVTVAMAKIEGHIRKNVRESRTHIEELNKHISEANKEIDSISENSAPKKTKLNFTKLKNTLKDIEGLEVKLVSENFCKTKQNQYTIRLRKNAQTIVIETILINYTKRQEDLLAKVESMKKSVDEIAKDGVRWKSKLSDMAAIERQMRAKVVEAELNKTTDGKAMVALLTKNYEETIKLLEM